MRGNDYDLDGRLIGISTTDPSSPSPLQSLTFGYDANNSFTAITNAANASLSQSFGYDALTRLTSVAFGSSSSTAWGYDADSNRSSQTVGSASSGYSLASGNNTLAGVTGAGARTFGYDVNGNRISDSGLNGAIVFHYDPFNRMDTATKGGTTTTYHVDPQGRRVYKSSGGSVWTHFVYGIDGTLLGENGAAGMTDYLWMGGQPIALVRNNTLYMVHTDQLGRPEIVTNAAKAVVWRASNFAFDRAVTLDTIGGLNLGFPGQYYDAETGLWNNGFRDYDASVGRYVESDPLGLAAGINTFGYVGGRPVSDSDPHGLDDPGLILWAAGVRPNPPNYRLWWPTSLSSAWWTLGDTTGVAVSGLIYSLDPAAVVSGTAFGASFAFGAGELATLGFGATYVGGHGSDIADWGWAEYDDAVANYYSFDTKE